MKYTWKIIGTLIQRKTKVQLDTPRIIRNNKLFTNRTDIDNQFNEYFTNVGPQLASVIKETGEDPTKYIHNSPTNSLYITPIDEHKVYSLFSTLDDKKTSLLIPNKLIKIAAKPLSGPLTHIFNQSISTGQLTTPWSCARHI